MAKTKVVYENEEQYTRRINAECEAEISKDMASEWFLYAQSYFQRKVDDAKDHGDVALSKFWFEEGNKFFRDKLTYISLGYKVAVEKPETYLLPIDESRRKTVNALARKRKYDKQLKDLKAEREGRLS